MRSHVRRRLLVPEVVQTSSTDCGPAVLKALLEGLGIPASYGRLREACQTDVDGTSIDTLEAILQQLGLSAEQVMLPVDHLLLTEAAAMPALLVVRQPNGFTHFVVLWRRHGPVVQIMDPAVGRRWLSCQQLRSEVYRHEQAVSAVAWRDWAASADFQHPLGRRLSQLGCRDGEALLAQATSHGGWQALARLDAATRLVRALGVRGRVARALLGSLASNPQRMIPEPFWLVRATSPAADGQEQLILRGAVLVRITAAPSRSPAALSPVASHDLRAALTEPPPRPGRELCQLLGGLGRWSWIILGAGLSLAAASVVLEGLLLRGVFELGRSLRLFEQRLAALAGLVGFGLALLVLEARLAGGLARLGRRLEVRLRAAFLAKLPRLHDRYFQSRPVSDMAERSHALHQLRLLPGLAGQWLRANCALALTVAVIAWLDPRRALPAAAAGLVALLLPLILLPLLQGLDLRVRTHAGALNRFYLDALLGLNAVRSHGAEGSIRREHESLLVEWARASRRYLNWVVTLEGVQLATGFALAGWLLWLHAGPATDVGGLLLLAYWALNLPVLGEEIGRLVRQYPLLRSVTLRLLEPLGTPEERTPAPDVLDARPPQLGLALTFEHVRVRAGGHTLLEDVHLDIAAGSHVAIVGASGAGKSTLLGLLLGWHRPASGQVRVDGILLDGPQLDRLRGATAWVDPTVQLWNTSLLDNLLYGADPDAAAEMSRVLDAADLVDVLQRLPSGLQTGLGEGGGLLSGGEGQRVRLARALLRSEPRLVLLDEACRGLDRATRRELLGRARNMWRGATLLCVTHDVAQTCDFERVLVIEAGKIVEDGNPAVLQANPGSRYKALLDAEEAVRHHGWAGAGWRRVRLAAGKLHEDVPRPRCTRCRLAGGQAVPCTECHADRPVGLVEKP